MEFSSVEEIEDLHENEGVEDESEVPGVDMVSLEAGLVVVSPTHKYHPSRANIIPVVFARQIIST